MPTEPDPDQATATGGGPLDLCLLPDIVTWRQFFRLVPRGADPYPTVSAAGNGPNRSAQPAGGAIPVKQHTLKH